MNLYPVYSVKLPENCETVIFINGIIARNIRGFLWLWRNLFKISQTASKAQGCIQIKRGICNFKEVIMVSYWQNQRYLNEFVQSTAHRNFIDYITRHVEHLTLYNEAYLVNMSGRYINEGNGLAKIYPKK